MLGNKLSKMMTKRSNPDCQPLFSFGILADVQYADIPNRLNFSKTSMRYYRNSLKLVHEAALSWNNELNKPAFVVHVGDLIDGASNKKGKANSYKALSNIMAEFDRFDGPVHHVVGNHDFYNFTRKELWDTGLNTTQLHSKGGSVANTTSSNPTMPEMDKCGCNNKLYYSFEPHPEAVFVVIDCFELSGTSHDKECPRHKEGMKILCGVNKNIGEELNSCTDLIGLDRRFVLFNGAIGKEQLTWLKHVLEEATRKKQKVYIMGHIPFSPDVTHAQCLLWNYDEVLEQLHQFDCVAAVISGHTHSYAYAKDTHGIHHIVLPGIVEVEPGNNAFATVDVYHDHFDVRGVGKMPSLYSLHFSGVKSENCTTKEMRTICDCMTSEETMSLCKCLNG